MCCFCLSLYHLPFSDSTTFLFRDSWSFNWSCWSPASRRAHDPSHLDNGTGPEVPMQPNQSQSSFWDCHLLTVNVGSICISKACPLIQKMMLSLLPAPLGGSENKLKQSSKGARIQGCSLTISCSLDLFGKLSFSRTPSISRIEILLHDVNN